ncbi:MAG: FHA domain-containing protein [Clostridiales bacterium]|nr:FHA domain-containing protein [Clostridiales bacterium]
MSDERTVFMQAQQNTPRLFALWDGQVCEFSLTGTQTLGRPGRNSHPDLVVPVGSVSRKHGEFLCTASGYSYRDLRSSNGTHLNGKMLQPNVLKELQDGDVLRIHGKEDEQNQLDVLLVYSTSYTQGLEWKRILLTTDIAEIRIGRSEAAGRKDSPMQNRNVFGQENAPLQGKNVYPPESVISLQNKSVSRHHASFFRASGGWALIDHDSLNGVRVNNRPIRQPVYLSAMDTVRIAGYLFFFTGTSLIYQTEAGSLIPAWESAPTCAQKPVGHPLPESVPMAVQRAVWVPPQEAVSISAQEPAPQDTSYGALSISIEERNVWHRMKKKTLLKDIRLEIAAGSMVLVLGGSGAGKTTFMNAVMGYEPAEGQIRYRGIDIYEEYERMKYEIGYVPQQDLLRLNDTVYATLLNAARMKLPSSFSRRELDEEVQKTMHALGLERERTSLVGKLSGGQRKRLSIAVEYIGNPSLFFLDEPDSGLDGTMARALMENLRSIADEGKIVIVISHSPDRAFDLFDQILVLAKSGRDDSGHLVFYGPPKKACEFFETDSLEKIVKRINRPDEGGDGRADEFIERYTNVCAK